MRSTTPRLGHAVTPAQPGAAVMAFAARGGMVAAALFFAAYALVQTVRYGVNIPFWDEWDWVLLARQMHAGEISLSGILLKSAAEHKIAADILLAMLSWSLTGMNLRAVMVWNWFVDLLFCAAGFAITRHELGRRSILPWIALAASSFFVFNPTAYQFRTWGVPHFHLLLPLILFLGVRLVQSRVGLSLKVLALAAMALVSSFILGSGLLFWIMFPAILRLYHRGWSRAASKAALAAAGLLLALTAAMYVHGFLHYTNPAPAGGITAGNVALFFLTYTGNFVAHCLSPQPLRLAQGAGLMTIALLLIASGTVLRNHQSGAPRRIALIWAGLGGYSILSAGAVAVARAGFGLAYALEASRYVLASCFLPIAAVVLAAMAIGGLARTLPVGILRYSSLVAALSVLVFIAGAARYMQTPAAESLLWNARISALHGKVAAAAAGVLDLPTYRNIFPREDPGEFRTSVAFLRRKGWLTPGPWDETFRKRLEALASASASYGALEEYQSISSGLRLEGWAYLADRDEGAHAVIVAGFEAHQEPRILAVAFPNRARPDVPATLRSTGAAAVTGWTAEVPGQAVAGHRYLIRCFAYNAETGAVHALKGERPPQ